MVCRIFFLLLLGGAVIFTLYELKSFDLWPIFFTKDQIDEIGQLSVVKDIRGDGKLFLVISRRS